jgi:uncharacterized protein YjbI with pentapeptide repeats
LTAYVRGHALWAPARPEQDVQNAAPDQLPYLQERDPDVQAAMTVLGRMPPSDRGRLDLHGTDLRRMLLIDAHLERANFSGAHLEGASFAGAHLEGALLVGATWRGRSSPEPTWREHSLSAPT